MKRQINTISAGRHTPLTDELLFSELLQRRYKKTSKSTRAIDHALLTRVVEIGGYNTRVADINTAFCRKLYRNMERDRLAQGTIRTYMSNLNTLLNLVRGGRRPSMMHLTPPRQSSHKEALSAEDVARLRVTPCRHQSTAEAFLFAMQTALRYSDVATLRWSDLSCMREGYVLHKKMVKTGKTVEVFLNETAVTILRHKNEQQRLKHDKLRGNRLVFHDLMAYSTIRNDLDEWGRRAEISLPHLTFHVARHTFASVTYAADIPLSTISKLLGHSSLRTTESYIHSFASNELQAVERINSYGNLDGTPPQVPATCEALHRQPPVE